VETKIVMPDEQYAVTELRKLRIKAEKSGAQIAQDLRTWQNSLGHGKFKKTYLLAGWTESKVGHYLQYYQEDADMDSCPDVADSKKKSQSDILWFIQKLEGVRDTLEQILTEAKWRQDKDFPQLQQKGKDLVPLLEKL